MDHLIRMEVKYEAHTARQLMFVNVNICWFFIVFFGRNLNYISLVYDYWVDKRSIGRCLGGFITVFRYARQNV